MSIDQVISALWRRKALFTMALLVCVGGVLAATFTLPKTYKGTATIYVGSSDAVDEGLALDTNLGEQLTRTYTALASNPNVAESVSLELDPKPTRDELLAKMSFAPVERTQLLEISAEARSASEAQEIANVYATVFVQRVNSAFARGETQTEIAVSEPAAVPANPVKPNPPLYIGLGILLSLALALATVLVRERFEDRILVADDDDTVLGQSIVGRIPAFPRRSSSAPSTMVNDAFWILKTNVDFVQDERSDVILVTSPAPTEGKSTVSARLALTAAAADERVLLIEADLRRPGLYKALSESAQPSKIGLTSFLLGSATRSQVLVPHPDMPGLDIIWAGALPPNPSHALRSRRLKTLIAELKLTYDRIIIDSPPVSVGADVALVSSLADGVLLVIDSRATSRRRMQAALNQLEKSPARLFGVVINRITSRGKDYGYYYTQAGDSAGLLAEPETVPSEVSPGQPEPERRRAGV